MVNPLMNNLKSFEKKRFAHGKESNDVNYSGDGERADDSIERS